MDTRAPLFRTAAPALLLVFAFAGGAATSGCSGLAADGPGPAPVSPSAEDGAATDPSLPSDAGGDPVDPRACKETAKRFAAKPTSFALPAARCDEAFDTMVGFGRVGWSLLDADGDRRADLVVTRDACDPDVGTKRWDVYAAGEKGFAKTPVSFALPAARCDETFDALAASGRLVWTVLDVDADRVPDLVVTRDGCDPDVGTKRWDVYPGSASGFAKTPTPFPLPAARCNDPFDATAGSGSVSWTLLDVDGDRKPDLVVTRDRCEADVGTKRWDVYPSSGSGFAKAPTAFGLPATRCNDPFDAVAGAGSVKWSLSDVNADERPDLVVTADTCDRDVGTKRWDVYAGSATGFTKAPTAFGLPTKRCDAPFDAQAGSGNVRWTLLDVSCDGRMDLVVTGDTCDTDVGAKRWDVYVASADGTGFAPAPATLGLPAGRCRERFDAVAKSASVPYALVDVSGDRRGDLVVTSDACDEGVGASHWDVYALE